MRPRERKHRLPEDHYFGRVGVSFTACEKHRRPTLIRPATAEALIECLEEAVLRHGCLVPAYCLMPDHLHAILVGTADESRPKAAMERFKWTTANWFGHYRPDLRWQKDFHDHILRAGEDWAAHARYILCNPCRAGLAEDALSWPWSGSIGTDLDDVIWDAFS